MSDSQRYHINLCPDNDVVYTSKEILKRKRQNKDDWLGHSQLFGLVNKWIPVITNRLYVRSLEITPTVSLIMLFLVISSG